MALGVRNSPAEVTPTTGSLQYGVMGSAGGASMLPQSADAAAIESVLVIDDSAVQRRHSVGLCRELGVGLVHEAGNGREALALLGALTALPSVLLVDLEMPTMDGPELLAQLRQRNIDVSIIVASSRERALLQSVRQMGSILGLRILGTIQKPLTRETLATLFAAHNQPCDAQSKPSRHPGIDAEALRSGIQREQIHAHFQPKMEIATGKICGAEALARWQEPAQGLILPDEFIPLAERHDLIHPLTLQILSQAMLQVVSWTAESCDLAVAVNLSPLLLDRPNLVEEVVQLQQGYGLPAERVIFEVTESSLSRDPAAALRILTRLRLRGFGLSLDDYGTGFASMAQLAQIPFTELKIDRAFVRGVCERETLRVMLRSTIAMAQELGLMTVAEGVETEEELELLRRYGCTVAQGWLIAKSMPPAQFAQWLLGRVKRS
jgi:EAL domain-containing protein (putative c-di-GMP-specific phosphodiesterase class I)